MPLLTLRMRMLKMAVSTIHLEIMPKALALAAELGGSPSSVVMPENAPK